MAWKYLGTLKRPLTRDIAEEFATMPCSKNDRVLRPSRLAMLSRKLETGDFFAPKWAVAYLNGKKHRVNGQHSSTALTQCNGHFPSGMDVLIDEFHCDSEDDLADLFEQFDNPASSRTSAEVVSGRIRLRDWASCYQEIHVRTAVSAAMLVRGLSNSIGNMRLNNPRFQDYTKAFAEILDADREWVEWYATAKKTTSMKMRCIAAAMYSTFRADRDDCENFWLEVADGTNPDPANPSRVLQQFLLRVEPKVSPERRQFGERGLYSKCIHGWNAWRRGERTNLKYSEASPIPQAI